MQDKNIYNLSYKQDEIKKCLEVESVVSDIEAVCGGLPGGGPIARSGRTATQNPCRKTGVFVTEKMKTDFQCVYPTWEQIKNTRHIFQNMSDLF